MYQITFSPHLQTQQTKNVRAENEHSSLIPSYSRHEGTEAQSNFMDSLHSTVEGRSRIRFFDSWPQTFPIFLRSSFENKITKLIITKVLQRLGTAFLQTSSPFWIVSQSQGQAPFRLLRTNYPGCLLITCVGQVFNMALGSEGKQCQDAAEAWLWLEYSFSALMWVQPICTAFKDSGRVRTEGELSQPVCFLVRNSLKGFHGRKQLKLVT